MLGCMLLVADFSTGLQHPHTTPGAFCCPPLSVSVPLDSSTALCCMLWLCGAVKQLLGVWFQMRHLGVMSTPAVLARGGVLC